MIVRTALAGTLGESLPSPCCRTEEMRSDLGRRGPRKNLGAWASVARVQVRCHPLEEGVLADRQVLGASPRVGTGQDGPAKEECYGARTGVPSPGAGGDRRHAQDQAVSQQAWEREPAWLALPGRFGTRLGMPSIMLGEVVAPSCDHGAMRNGAFEEEVARWHRENGFRSPPGSFDLLTTHPSAWRRVAASRRLIAKPAGASPQGNNAGPLRGQRQRAGRCESDDT